MPSSRRSSPPVYSCPGRADVGRIIVDLPLQAETPSGGDS